MFSKFGKQVAGLYREVKKETMLKCGKVLCTPFSVITLLRWNKTLRMKCAPCVAFVYTNTSITYLFTKAKSHSAAEHHGPGLRGGRRNARIFIVGSRWTVMVNITL